MTAIDSTQVTPATISWHEQSPSRRPGGSVWRETSILMSVLVMLPFIGALLFMLGISGWIAYRDYVLPGAPGGNPMAFGGIAFVLIVLTVLVTGMVNQVNNAWLRGVPAAMLRDAANGASEDLDRQLNNLLRDGEQVLWARRLHATRRLSGGAELLTSQRALQVIGGQVTAIAWGEASSVAFRSAWNNGCSLTVLGPPEHDGIGSSPVAITFGRCRDSEAIAAALRVVLAPPRRGLPLPGAPMPIGWEASLAQVLTQSEQITWTGQPQRLYRLAILDRLAKLQDMNQVTALLMLSLIAMFAVPIFLLEVNSNPIPALEFIWVAWVAAVALFYARPPGHTLLYVITDRRTFQLHAHRLTRRISFVCYPRRDTDILRIQPPRIPSLLPGSVNLVIAVEQRNFDQIEIAFRDLPEFEAARALSLLSSLDPNHRVEPGRAKVASWEQRLGPKSLARIKAVLSKNERVLWANEVRVTDVHHPLSTRAYVLTSRRAIVSASEVYTRVNRILTWEAIKRIQIEQKANGSGTVTFAVPTTMAERVDKTCVFRRCPDISHVRQVIEQQVLGETTAGPRGAIDRNLVANAVLGAGVPETWREGVADALLPGESVRWIGRGDKQAITAIWQRALVFGLVIAVGVGIITFVAGNRQVSAGALVVGLLMVWGAQVMIRRMCDLAYVVTERRALQLGGLDSKQRRSVEFYPGITRARIWSSVDAAYDQVRRDGPGCADINISDHEASSKRGMALATFTAVPRDEVTMVTELLQSVYGTSSERAASSTSAVKQVPASQPTTHSHPHTSDALVPLTSDQWSSWRWMLLACIALALSAAIAFGVLSAGHLGGAVGTFGIGVLLAGTQLWRHGVILARGLSSTVALEQSPLTPGQRTRAHVTLRGRGRLRPLRVTLVCRGQVHDGRSTIERTLHEEILAEIDQLDLRPNAPWQHTLGVAIPPDAPRSRVPESNTIVHRQERQHGYSIWRSFRRVRSGHTVAWKEIGLNEPDFEWVTWTIEVQANGGWGARWVAFTHRYTLNVAASSAGTSKGIAVEQAM